ncbi:MAG: hypothetical protein AAFU49_12400 [Pseudomonadota bacterium]
MDSINPTVLGAANDDMLKERLRLRRLLKKIDKLRSIRKIEMTKVHTDAYEKHLRLMVQKHGPDPKNKDVKWSYDALLKELSRLTLDYYNVTARLKRLRGEIKGDPKKRKALQSIWAEASKAFLGAATTAASLPQTSGLVPSLWSNMQVSTDIARLLGKVSDRMKTVCRTLDDNVLKAEDELHFIGQHLELVLRKNYLKTL